MKKALFVAMIMGLGLVGCAGSEGEDPTDEAQTVSAPEADVVSSVCQGPGTSQGSCLKWGDQPFQSGCGSTWSYWVCTQYKNSQNQKWYAYCGSQNYWCGSPFGTFCLKNCD